jgi:hypothetical protein
MFDVATCGLNHMLQKQRITNFRGTPFMHVAAFNLNVKFVQEQSYIQLSSFHHLLNDFVVALRKMGDRLAKMTERKY